MKLISFKTPSFKYHAKVLEFVKSNGSYSQPFNSSHDSEFEFCAHSARLVMFCFGYLTPILDCDSAVSVQNKEKCLAMFCLYTLPLTRPAQAKTQMLTTSSWIVTMLLKPILKSFGLHSVNIIISCNVFLIFSCSVIMTNNMAEI